MLSCPAYAEGVGAVCPAQKDGRERPEEPPDSPRPVRVAKVSWTINGEQPCQSKVKGLRQSYLRGHAMRILIAEDDPVIADGLSRALRQTGYAVDWAPNGADAEHALTGTPYDLLILDLGLPKVPGLEVLRRLRSRDNEVPVLILTALDGVEDRVKGLDLGADDYLVKPFEIVELEARIRALTRRSSGTAKPTMQVGSLSYDQVGRAAYIEGQPIELSAREMGLLEVFVSRAGRLVSKDQLVDHLCGWGEEVSHNAIEVYVHRLRKKLEPGGVKINTVRGLGYCLEKPQDQRPG